MSALEDAERRLTDEAPQAVECQIEAQARIAASDIHRTIRRLRWLIAAAPFGTMLRLPNGEIVPFMEATPDQVLSVVEQRLRTLASLSRSGHWSARHSMSEHMTLRSAAEALRQHIAREAA